MFDDSTETREPARKKLKTEVASTSKEEENEGMVEVNLFKALDL